MRGEERRGDLEPDMKKGAVRSFRGKLSSTHKLFLLLYTHKHRLKDAFFIYGRLGSAVYFVLTSVTWCFCALCLKLQTIVV